ncbi:protein ACCELERATED CELL DEATH 6 isoform X2 [Hevea brasiliensis]|uniref:protein ACCELERATED CELL DEATH 6 isoform X2 n=1 Tax=Hevea brasiliensis TaxID=3981 RepID=UPI0025E0C19F|nr:protein ACCELERATED CELL DEATH 6 isoform X2 [Hevea brasiliensis]
MSTASIKCNHRICPHRGDNLTEAAERGRFDRFNEHLDHLDFIVTPNGNTILHIHLSRQREISTDFIEQVVVQCPRLLSQENFDGNTPLHIAASHGYTNVAEKLIRLAEALHDALDSRRREVAINILQNEVEAAERANRVVREMLRKVNEKGETALHVAARNGRSLGVLKAILSKEDPQFAYPVNNLGESPLYLAVDSTCTKIVAELLNNPNSQSLEYDRLYGRYDETVLHTAVRRWDTEIVRMLLEKQSSLAKKEDGRGKTPLHYAAYEGSSSMVTTLLDNDEYIARQLQVMGALHIAAAQGYKHAMNEIISKRPDCCKLTDTEGKNVLHYAVYSRHEEVLKAILEESSLISLIIEKDNNGNTPVHVFKALNLPLSSFILDGDTDAFILWKKLYCSLPEDFTIENSLLWSNEDHFKVTKRHPERKTEMAKKREEKIILQLEKAKDSHLVAAALVATVTFAAAFTLPGGYISDEKDSGKGTPILIKNSAFKAFIISDALAMALSTSSVFIYFIMVMLGYGPKYYWLIKTAFRFIFLAMGAMVVAFATGTYAVLAPSLGLAISTCAIGLSFFLFLFYVLKRLSSIPDDYDHERILTLLWLSFGGYCLV